ncbi:MAG: nuclease, partial [Nitrososphaerota archaeon]|nr:nuclease [Nitrososphaerota archaeon]
DGNVGKTYIRFTSKKLDNLIPKLGEGWVSSNRIVLFEFTNYYKKEVLRLYIGPGDDGTRRKLHDIAMMDKKLFNKSERKLGSKWLAIYQKEFLKPSDYDESDNLDLEQIISKKFESFIGDDLPKIEKHITENWK